MQMDTCEPNRLGVSLLLSITRVHEISKRKMCIQCGPKCQQLADALQSWELVDRKEAPAHPPPPFSRGLDSGPPAQLPVLWQGPPAGSAGTVLPSPGLLPAPGTVLLCCVPGRGSPPCLRVEEAHSPTQHVLLCKLGAAVAFYSFT